MLILLVCFDGLNLCPPACKADALPTELPARIKYPTSNIFYQKYPAMSRVHFSATLN